MSLNPEDVEALSSAMLAMGGSAAGPGVGMPLEMTDEAPPAGAAAEGAEQRDQGPGVPAAEGAADEDAVAWAKRWASHLVRHFR